MTHTAYVLLDVLYTLLLKNKCFFYSDNCDIASKLFNKSDDFSGVGGPTHLQVQDKNSRPVPNLGQMS